MSKKFRPFNKKNTKPVYLQPLPLDRYYFAYGSNTNLKQMKQRCPRAKAVGVFTLNDFALMMRGVADIEQVSGARCHGVLWKISSACEASLDRAEGFPHFYGKETIEVYQGSRAVQTIVYTMQEKSWPYRPCKSYYDRIRDGYNTFNIAQIQLDDACDFSHRGLDGPYANRKQNKIPHLHPQLEAHYDELEKQWQAQRVTSNPSHKSELFQDDWERDSYYTKPSNSFRF